MFTTLSLLALANLLTGNVFLAAGLALGAAVNLVADLMDDEDEDGDEE